ncbi:MAG: malto-oligosyltrehalose synthase, partial [Micrococcales bacterium]|nr:malto-oligosyltrehalose synthase [Micrococcales bacterium]
GQRPDLETELRALVPMTVGQDDDPATVDFSVRLQQTWGPVMAKGIEDTTFYRWHRLVALNEVGGDPADLDLPASGAGSGVDLLHRWAQRQQADWPEGMTTLSTHDTKRSEDVRARIIAVAGDPESWQTCSRAAREAARESGVDAPTAHLVWQTILGVGHISAQRLEDYLLKALREAKQHTAWVDGDPDYEARVVEFARSLRDPGPVHDAIEAAVTKNAEAIRATILAAKALCLTLPGLPDTYQGCEIVELSLVDPDNRRPVDYPLREALLRSLDAVDSSAVAAEAAGVLVAASPLDAEKHRLTSRVLRLRRERPELFGRSSSYTPLAVDDDHVLGFARTAAVGLLAGVLRIGREGAVATLVTRAPARLAATGGWGERLVELPAGSWRDIVTGAVHEGGSVRGASVFASSPVAVLLRE